MREERTEVLVVGAGPVGLLTAILLAEAGIEVRIIDREERTTARSYACALHPRTLKLLERMGLAAPMLERGRRSQTVAFYDGATRRAEVKLSELSGEFPFMVILPQNEFESALEQRLRKAGVAVNWNHRFDDLQSAGETVVANVEELGATGTGYIVPHWETVVEGASRSARSSWWARTVMVLWCGGGWQLRTRSLPVKRASRPTSSSRRRRWKTRCAWCWMSPRPTCSGR